MNAILTAIIFVGGSILYGAIVVRKWSTARLPRAMLVPLFLTAGLT